MFDPNQYAHVTWPEQAPHTFGEQPEQAIEAYRDGMMPIEHAETSRLSDPARIPPAERDLASDDAMRSSAQPEDIDPEMTIAWGEDPGWIAQESQPYRSE